jgi:hypothetical protein
MRIAERERASVQRDEEMRLRNGRLPGSGDPGHHRRTFDRYPMALEPHHGATEALALLGGEVRQDRRVEDHERRFWRRPCRERMEQFDQISPYHPRSLSARDRDGLPQARQTVQLLRPHQGLEPADGLARFEVYRLEVDSRPPGNLRGRAEGGSLPPTTAHGKTGGPEPTRRPPRS